MDVLAEGLGKLTSGGAADFPAVLALPSKKKWDLIILDIVMRGTSIGDVIAKIRDVDPWQSARYADRPPASLRHFRLPGGFHPGGPTTPSSDPIKSRWNAAKVQPPVPPPPGCQQFPSRIHPRPAKVFAGQQRHRVESCARGELHDHHEGGDDNDDAGAPIHLRGNGRKVMRMPPVGRIVAMPVANQFGHFDCRGNGNGPLQEWHSRRPTGQTASCRQ